MGGSSESARERGVSLRSIAYGEGPRRRLDIYRPKRASGAPVIVFFYGGSWQRGRKETYRFVGRALARWGYVAVIPDYRVYPDVRYPGFIEDGAAAVAWTAARIAEAGGDPETIFLMGHSAGAYIAAMLAVDPAWTGKRDRNLPSRIAGLIGISGPYDFLPIVDPRLQAVFGGPAVTETQPIAHVGRRPPPALLIAGDRDRIVDPANSSRMAKRLAAAGGVVTLARYRFIGHVLAIAAFALPWLFSPLAPMRRDITRFIAGTLAGRDRHTLDRGAA